MPQRLALPAMLFSAGFFTLSPQIALGEEHHHHEHKDDQHEAVRREKEVTPLTAHKAWARSTRKNGKVGVAYLTVQNSGESADAISATSEKSGDIELHTHIRTDEDTMKMVELEEISVPAGGMAELKPGSDHLMLFEFLAP